MKITFLGGANEIGASCLLIEVANSRLLIDAGLRPKVHGEASLPALDRLTEPPDAVIITHAHIDHLGALPVVHQRFPQKPVLASEPTRALARVMLLDSAYLQGLLPGPPLYAKDDVQRTLTHLRPLLMGRWYHLSAGVALCMVPAGHLLGAVSLLLDTAEGRVVISGDVSLTHQRAVPGFAALPFAADVLILESTYGDSLHPVRQEEERRLVEQVTGVVMAGGTALVPSFALGRAQEVMLTLRQAQLANEIPAYPIFADGLVRAVTEIYHRKRAYLTPALQKGNGHSFWKKGRVIKVKAAQRRQILNRPACIVASSGMLFGGPSVFYARHLIEDAANAIFITGYTDEESPGRRLQELTPGDKLVLDGEPYKVACQVYKFGLSGHADAEQLAALVNHFRPRLTFLVHGEKEGRAGLEARLPSRHTVHLPMNTEQVTLDSPKWMMGQSPFLLGQEQKGSGKSQAADEVTPLAGEASSDLPRLKIRRETIVEGALVREAIPSQFQCFYCGQEKLLTVDLARRQIAWSCSNCGRQSEDNIKNLKQKDVSKLSEAEQEILADLILISVRLHEPVLEKDWLDLLGKPEEWQHWLSRLEA